MSVACRCVLLLLPLFLAPGPVCAQRPVTFPLPDQSAQIHGDLYGEGTRAVVLAHGGRFSKESWKKQANLLASEGFLALALQFRGDRSNPDGSPGSFGSNAENAMDVLAAVAYLRHLGAKTVSAVGGSLGGDAVGEADARSKPGEMDRIVLLGSDGGNYPERMTGRKLFLFARDDASGTGPRRTSIIEHYGRVSQPKELIIVEGSAHAQFLFDTPQGSRVFREILLFLTAR